MRSTRRVGLGCMLLSRPDQRDESAALETLAAAIASGVNLFDTAPSYGLGEHDQHHNERLLAKAILAAREREELRIVTKGGLVRVGTAWVPDGRAKSLRASAERSLEALGGLPIDLYLLHAVDPKTPLRTSVRALAALKRASVVKRIGVSNVSLRELDLALEEADLDAIEVAFGACDDAAAKGGVIARALALGLEVIAHSPLGGQKRARRLARDEVLGPMARSLGVSAASVFLGWLYGLSPLVVPIPGASRAETARAAGEAPRLEISDADRATLDQRYRALARSTGRLAPALSLPRSDAEVVLVMGIQGAGKSSSLKPYLEQGYERLNRDERGGSLVGISEALAEGLRRGGRRFVLDNTYATRAARSRVIEAARDNAADVRCVWLDTPLERAQVNAAMRLLERYDALPAGDELKALAKTDPQAWLPTVQWRFRRELEEPSVDEGFVSVERRVDPIRSAEWEERPGIVVARDAFAAIDPAILRVGELAKAPVLVFAWEPGAHSEDARGELRRRFGPAFGGDLDAAVCSHAAGPPTCWCRPPLPGLLLSWARASRVDLRRSLLVGRRAADRALAAAVGATLVHPPAS